MKITKQNRQISIKDIRENKYPTLADKIIVDSFTQFIDVGSTATDRATFYNTKSDVVKATVDIHKNLYSVNRGIYAASLLLDGITDYTKQIGIENLLRNEGDKNGSMIPLEVETHMIAHIMSQMPVQRVFKMFENLKAHHVNNARTRRVILLSILNSDKLEWWSVKYRQKLFNALEHAWGRRTTSIIKNIIAKNVRSEKEAEILNTYVFKYVDQPINKVEQCLMFILGGTNNKEYTLPLLKAFVESKTDISKGTVLPREVLEGIRSTYHKDIKTAKVLDLTKQNLTDKEKMKVQKNAAIHNVQVTFDPRKQDVVDLYIHSYANDGVDDKIRKILAQKAEKTSKDLPIGYNSIGILIDASGSTRGSDTQALRPIAISQAIRDMLQYTADSYDIEIAGGRWENGLIYPEGDTNLADALIKLIEKMPDAIFIISDGYENAPAGRVNEIVEVTKKIGLDIEFHQITPVMASESKGIKNLSNQISVIPASKPNAITMAMLKAMLEQNAKNGIMGLFDITLKKLN